MIKKKTLIISSIIAVGLISSLMLGFTNSYSKNSKNLGDLSKTAKLLEKNKNLSKVVATIDDKKIYENDLKSARLGRMDNDKVSDKEIANILINKEVLYTEAINRNLEASDSEIKESIDLTKEEISKDTKLQAQLNKMLSDMEISSDKYWNEVVYNSYKKNITINKFKQNIVNNAKDTKSFANIKSNNESLLDDYINDLRKNHKIEIFI